MAVRARFGRLPRSAPSLTSTIIALAQEYQRVRDTNIEEAWKNGGMFEGKKVTDNMMLNYWTERRDSVSKDDPMWDYYNNQLHGYKFNIEETKHYLAYKRGNLSEAGMARFYAEWARKMPQNSANWRSLMTKAAEFRDSAARGSSSTDYAAREERYQRNQQHTKDKFEAPWDVFEQSVMEWMIGENYVDRSVMTTNNNGGWAAFNDPSILNNILWRLNNDPDLAKTKARLVRAMDDPGFSGTFTEHDLERLNNRKQDGLRQRKIRANKTGHAADANAIVGEQQRADAASFALQTADFQAIVARKGRELNNVMSDPTATPQEQAQAIRDTRAWLDGEGRRMIENEMPGRFDPLSGKPTNEFAADLMGQLNGTISALDGKARGTSLWDDPYGQKGSTEQPGSTSMAQKVADTAADVLPQADALAAGKGVLMRIGEDGEPTHGPGSGWAVYDRSDPRLGGEDIHVMTNPEGVQQGYKAAPIKVEGYKGLDPDTRMPVGNKVTLNRDENVGQALTYDTGNGEMVTLYGIFVNGEMRWTHVNPVMPSSGSRSTVNPDGSITITSLAPDGKVDTSALVDRAGLGATKQGNDGVPYIIGSQSSPMQARLRANDADSMRVANMPDDVFAAQERDYFERHPTTAMQNAAATQGEAGFEAALQNELRMGLNKKVEIRAYGPESQRERVMSQMQARATAETEARLENQQINDRGLRAEMMRDVIAWQKDTQANIPVSPVSGAPLGGPLPSLSDVPGSGNWTLAELLTSPKISTQHAKAIASYLTNGAVAGEPGKMVPGAPQYNTFDLLGNAFGNYANSLVPRSTRLTPIKPIGQGPATYQAAPPPPVPAAVPDKVKIEPDKVKPETEGNAVSGKMTYKPTQRVTLGGGTGLGSRERKPD